MQCPLVIKIPFCYNTYHWWCNVHLCTIFHDYWWTIHYFAKKWDTWVKWVHITYMFSKNSLTNFHLNGHMGVHYITDNVYYNKEYMHYVVDSPSATDSKHMWIHCECHFHTIFHIPYTKWSHWPKHEYFFWKTALADPIFTLVLGFQSFWAAFNLLVTVVPLKVALGWGKIDFWVFKKIITQV